MTADLEFVNEVRARLEECVTWVDDEDAFRQPHRGASASVIGFRKRAVVPGVRVDVEEWLLIADRLASIAYVALDDLQVARANRDGIAAYAFQGRTLQQVADALTAAGYEWEETYD